MPAGSIDSGRNKFAWRAHSASQTKSMDLARHLDPSSSVAPPYSSRFGPSRSLLDLADQYYDLCCQLHASRAACAAASDFRASSTLGPQACSLPWISQLTFAAQALDLPIRVNEWASVHGWLTHPANRLISSFLYHVICLGPHSFDGKIAVVRRPFSFNP